MTDARELLTWLRGYATRYRFNNEARTNLVTVADELERLLEIEAAARTMWDRYAEVLRRIEDGRPDESGMTNPETTLTMAWVGLDKALSIPEAGPNG